MRKSSITGLKIKNNNRGSGIVTVLICMLCVMLMASAVLYVSYVGLRIKATERQSKLDFYDAETAMDEIRAGIQGVASDAIASSYKIILENYNNANFISEQEDDMTRKFQLTFIDELGKWADDDKIRLIESGSNTYSLDVIKSFVNPSRLGNGVEITSSNGRRFEYNSANDTLLFKGVTVTYTNPTSDYETMVTADIKISMPDFTYIVSEFSVMGVPEFVIIAKDGIKQEIGNSTLKISGSAYAKSLSLSGKDSQFNISDGTIVIAETINVSDGGSLNNSRLNLESDSSLWAQRIVVGNEGTISLRGTTYVADDLDLSGYKSKATLGGSYYGFGRSMQIANESSSILINNRDTTLDISGLGRLMLAGHSFISDYYSASVGSGASSVLTGESLSVKTMQQAYLIPAEYLVGVTNNPAIYTTENPPDATLTVEGQAALDAYDATVKTLSAKVPGATGQTVTYYFMNFATEKSANDYFGSYFAANPTKINSYLRGYTTLSSTSGIMQTAGYTIIENADGTYALKSYIPSSAISTSAQQMSDTFTQLKKSLFKKEAGATEDNPYNFFVKDDMIKASANPGSTMEFKNADNEIVALIVNGDYTITSALPSTVCVIVATGDVYINSHFKGLVVSGGTINVNTSAELISDAEAVTAAFLARNSAKQYLAEFMRDGTVSTGSEIEEDKSSWNLSQLVSYGNWKKN